MLSERRSARASCHAAATLTAAPSRPTTSTIAALHLRRRREALHGLDRDHAGEHEQRRAVDLRREHLGAAEPEREAPARRPRGQPRGDQRERQRAGVGEHVRGVGEQRQRVGEQARDDLGDHEREDQRERRREPPAVGVGRHRVVVVLMGVVCVGV